MDELSPKDRYFAAAKRQERILRAVEGLFSAQGFRETFSTTVARWNGVHQRFEVQLYDVLDDEGNAVWAPVVDLVRSCPLLGAAVLSVAEALWKGAEQARDVAAETIEKTNEQVVETFAERLRGASEDEQDDNVGREDDPGRD